jgi:sugar phosphate isomerase/epimerase
MFDVSISQMTTTRWDFADDLTCFVSHGYDAVAAWRPKVSDVGIPKAAALIAAAGVRVSSVHWAGGFTGGDGRSFDECLDDASDAIDMADGLAAGVVVLHSGCRGGHTRSHASRLLGQALEALAPRAARAGVVLAITPMHASAAAGCSFLNRLSEAVDFVERFDHAIVRLALDLWHWADDPHLRSLVPRLADITAITQVADRIGPPTTGGDRLPPGHGSLPLEEVLGDLIAAGFCGDVEFNPVGEAVEVMGYDSVLAETRGMAAAWSSRLAAEFSQPVELPRPHVGLGYFRTAGSSRSGGAPSRGGDPSRARDPRRAGDPFNSQASSHTVSPG